MCSFQSVFHQAANGKAFNSRLVLALAMNPNVNLGET
jgi:hypothetical protein